MAAPLAAPAPPEPTVDEVVRTRRRTRASQAMIRRLDPASVARTAALFWASVSVIGVIAGAILWMVAGTTGLIDNTESMIEELFALESFSFRAGIMAQVAVLTTIAGTVIGTVLTTVLALLFNVIADVVGGVRVTVAEVDAPPRRSAV